MFRQIARVATLAVVLVVAATVPPRAQDQKGTLVFAVESLGAQTLDPILEGRPGNAVYQAVMYDSLIGFDLEKGGVGPGVAERWELSPDGLEWTFYLRSGRRFHNGDKLTAEDVKFSLEAPDGPGLAGLRRGEHAAHDQEHRGDRRADGEGRDHQPSDRPAGRAVARGGAGRRHHAQGLY